MRVMNSLYEKNDDLAEIKHAKLEGTEGYSRVADPIVRDIMISKGIPKENILDYGDMTAICAVANEARSLLKQQNFKLVAGPELDASAYKCAVGYFTQKGVPGGENLTYEDFKKHRTAYDSIRKAKANGQWPEVAATSKELNTSKNPI